MHFFRKNNANSHFLNLNLNNFDNYEGDKRWTPVLYSRITEIKNLAIRKFIKEDYDYLFLTDSDLILHPNTLLNLVKQKRNFCSSIFWTKFNNSSIYTPNAWYSKPKGFDFTDLEKFKQPSTLAVDFTGACTLLSREILESNVNFKKIPNLHYLGEDKHFCIRASVLGFQAFVNTEYPSFHIYSDRELKLAEEWLKNNYSYDYLKCWLDKSWEQNAKKWVSPKKNSLIKKIIMKIKR